MNDPGLSRGFKQIKGHELIYSWVDDSRSLRDFDALGLRSLQSFNSSRENSIEVLIHSFYLITSTCPGARIVALTIPGVFSISDIDHEYSFSIDGQILLRSFGGSKVRVISVPISTRFGQLRSGQPGRDYVIFPLRFDLTVTWESRGSYIND
jgi:hypothetical protein